ncbi:MliC family protein [Kaistella palustris]|uniref:MliC family protein n=1 Tax=Kaistella palustris TaxID=493376 RepID=UPI000421E394|nr:MliC family protein [Kaistella palustris]
MNIKFLLPAVALSLTLASCSKEKTETTAMDSSVDSMAMPAQDSTIVAAPEADTMQTGNTFNYVSNDGKTKFTLTHDAANGTVVVKNETDGKTYNMKQEVSGSGEKYVDENGYYFIGHQGEFYFGKDDKDLVTGKRQ